MGIKAKVHEAAIKAKVHEAAIALAAFAAWHAS